MPGVIAAVPGRGLPAFHVLAGGELRGFTFQGRLFLSCSGHIHAWSVCLCVCMCAFLTSKFPSFFFFPLSFICYSQCFVADKCFVMTRRVTFLSPLCCPSWGTEPLSPLLSLCERSDIFTAASDPWCEGTVCRCFHDAGLFLLQIQL